MSFVRQTSLLQAGCQPWSSSIVASKGHQFAYCASLAIYFYEYDDLLNEYKLSSISAIHEKTIRCISWNKEKSNLIACAGADDVINVWDNNINKIVHSKTNVKAPRCIDWLPGAVNAHTLAYCCDKGPIYLWETEKDKTVEFNHTAYFDHSISIFRWHHLDPTKFVTGHIDGSLSLFYSGKMKKHILQSESKNSEDLVCDLLWDPLSTDYLLVSRTLSGIQLVDTNSLIVVTRFLFPSKMLYSRTISWIDSAPGMFVTGDAQSGMLRLWSVSKSTPIQSINLKSVGFLSLHALDSIQQIGSEAWTNSAKEKLKIRNKKMNTEMSTSLTLATPPAKIFCGFADGGFGLYNLQSKKWEMFRDQGHSETIFDCKFKPDNSNLLATGSFDGTIKVWSVENLSVVESSTGNEGIIYSISWAPGDLNLIAASTRRRGVFVWDLNTLKIIQRFKEHGQNAVYCVAWNQLDSHRIASCGDDSSCVIRRLDGEIVKRYPHPGRACGCDWSLLNADMLATGCFDGIVRVFDLSKKSDKAHIVLEKHSARVFHVRWHPILSNLLCSGSDDQTIKVWDTNHKTCLTTLIGHQANVRGLCWNYELPHLLASGSWDSTLRVWDIRTSECIQVISDHGADVYGLASHPNSPFSLATTSRDSTVRIWSLTSLVENLIIKTSLEYPFDQIIATSTDQVMKFDSKLRLAGNTSKQIVKNLQQNDHLFFRIRWFSELLYSNSFVENIWDLVGIFSGQSETILSSGYKNGILHLNDLIKYKMAEAQTNELKLNRGNTATRGREKLLIKLADQQLKLGNLKRYCELLIELDDWQRALSHAPAVSMDFWRQLTIRYAEKLKLTKDEDAFTYYLSAGKTDEAVDELLSQNNLQDALLVARVAEEGNFKALESVDQRRDEIDANSSNSQSLALKKCINQLAAKSTHSGHVFYSACIYLSNSRLMAALQTLYSGNELCLILCLARVMKIENELVVTVARTFAQKCNNVHLIDVGLKVLKVFDSDFKESRSKWNVIHHLYALSSLDDLVYREIIQKSIDLTSMTTNLKRAEVFEKEGKTVDAARFYLLSPNPNKAVPACLKLLTDQLSKDDWNIDDFDDEIAVIFSVPTHVLTSTDYKEFKYKLLATSAYIGAVKAYVWKYDIIVKPLLQCAVSLLDLLSDSSEFPLKSQSIKSEIATFNSNKFLLESKYLSLTPKSSTKDFMKNTIITNGSRLPTHSDVHISTITSRKIKIFDQIFLGDGVQGQHVFMEDGRMVMSLNEAIMWSRCNQFSPTCTGHRIQLF